VSLAICDCPLWAGPPGEHHALLGECGRPAWYAWRVRDRNPSSPFHGRPRTIARCNRDRHAELVKAHLRDPDRTYDLVQVLRPVEGQCACDRWDAPCPTQASGEDYRCDRCRAGCALAEYDGGFTMAHVTATVAGLTREVFHRGRYARVTVEQLRVTVERLRGALPAR
jgi:hypothetical protein